MSLANSSQSHRALAARRGFTLLEVLIATAVTLLMMLSLAQVFKVIGDSMKQGRAALELNSRLRNVAHRIQLDLNNCTVTPRPGVDALTGVGYFKIYDGPLTDYSYGTELASANRFGDVDDVIMFTARAGDDWFTGKVPLYVLQGVAPTTANLELVTITAQHAEIVIFAEPVATNENNPDRNSAYLILNPSENYAKLPNPATGAVTDLPAGYRLYYRTLLIRPDLNLQTGPNAGALPGSLMAGSTVSNQMVAQRGTARDPHSTATVNLPWPTCDMAFAHQLCDLSIRRVDQFPAGVTATSQIAANSLEDLANPANRFAHVQIPLSNGSNPDFSLPILALSPKLTMPSSNITTAEPGILITNTSTTADLENRFNYQSGFLHPAFTLTSDRMGEDVLASDLLAFDVKAYDPGVTLFQITSGGNTVVVSPNDPGYGTGLTSGTSIASGDFVDVGWGRKCQVHFGNSFGLGQLSGVQASGGAPFSDSLYRSGLVLQSDLIASPPTTYSANLLVHQPSYDTWYSRYEGDGALQCEVGGVNSHGVIRVNLAGTTAPKEAWRANGGTPIIDAGTDGIDNNTATFPGVDDLSEFETSAPFPVELRGVKISIRMENPAARQFNQMSVVKEFVTQ